ncbi:MULTISPECIES: hypothetical protein [Clostridium]|uniref:Uncharacterized protein n=1 Tax=Clostridium cibarium TaxID=2762247 RepID=A0ABR8PV86_9CLOT|nr:MULTISPECIES: hypothetical protein [Clostridium]MBD7912052.1 hypothetical protein [Clostridium cibarium]
MSFLKEHGLRFLNIVFGFIIFVFGILSNKANDYRYLDYAKILLFILLLAVILDLLIKGHKKA